LAASRERNIPERVLSFRLDGVKAYKQALATQHRDSRVIRELKLIKAPQPRKIKMKMINTTAK
jgi:hypothetical protein